MRKRLLVSTIPAVVCAVLAAPAGAATRSTKIVASNETTAANESVSENWAGYVDKTKSGTNFSAASASWREPSVKCTTGESSYSAYWVGLGGGSSSSDALEQEGTQADCKADGSVTHYAWYELVPSAPVRIAMKVSAGDQMYARTAVSGDEVTVQVDDRTTGKSFDKTIKMTKATPDTSTAEWVAEAPSECSDSTLSDCQVLSLADFGTVKFTNAYATAGGHTGTISDSRFSSTPVALEASAGFLGGGYGGYGYSGSSTAGSSGYGQSSSSGYGQSGYGESSSGAGDGYGDSDSGGYSDGWGSGLTGSGWGMGYGPIAGTGQVSDATLTSVAGAAAPSTLSGGGTAFSVYYGKEPTSDSSSSLTGSSTGTNSSTSTSTGTGTGSTDGGGWGDSSSTSPWSESGSTDGWGDSSTGDGSVTIGGYTLSWGPDGLTVSAS
jgi:hypothetical protein